MFERFAPSARAAVKLARAHASRLGSPIVGTEHLLLALTAPTIPVHSLLAHHGVTTASVADAVGAAREFRAEGDREALASLGIDLDRVREAAEAEFGPGALDGARPRRRRLGPTFSPHAKTALELSLREALRLRSRAIEPEHLLLGVLREGQGLACVVLERHRVSFVALRADLEARVARRSA